MRTVLVALAIATAALSALAVAGEARGQVCTPKRSYLEETVCTAHGEVKLEEAGQASVSISFRDCGPAKVELGKKTYRTRDACNENWREPRRNGLLLFFQTPKWFDNHYKVSVSIVDDDKDLEREVPMRIHYGGRTIKRWLYAVVSHHGSKKIWEGTDAFVNVCINRGLEIRSSGGVLYCETRGWVYRELQLGRKRFRI